MELSHHTENGITIMLKENHAVPRTRRTFFNPKMQHNRELCLAALNAHIDGLPDCPKPLCCLDAFSATGISGLQWKRHLGSSVSVTLNDNSSDNHAEILHHVQVNGMVAVDSDLTTSDREVQVTCQDANVILHQRQFHFIHLDPFGCVASFLDAAFRNVFNGGVVVATCTDVAALYGTCPAPALRNYGARVARTDFVKEMAARVVVSAMARSAAKCNKGLEVLFCAAAEHFIQVAVSVSRGAVHADHSISHIHEVIACTCCQSFAVNDRDTFCRNVSPYEHLPCDCRTWMKSDAAIMLGPIWCGDIFKAAFVAGMSSFARQARLSEQLQSLLTVIHGEAMLGCVEAANSSCTDHTVQQPPDDGTGTEDATAAKWLRRSSSSQKLDDTVKPCSPVKIDSGSFSDGVQHTATAKCSSTFQTKDAGTLRLVTSPYSRGPMFYYCPHRRRLKNVNLPKLTTLVRILRNEGFLAAATHFDQRGAVRTNAPWKRVSELLTKHFSQK